MLTAVIALHILVSFILIASVLLQVGKGASIGSAFGGAGSQTLFGSAGPANLLTKITGLCAIIFMATSLYLTLTGSDRLRPSIMLDVPEISAPAETAPEAAPTPETKEPAPETKLKEAKDTAPIKTVTPEAKKEPAKETAPEPKKK
jgi:preprotein translocase subunit SecG